MAPLVCEFAAFNTVNRVSAWAVEAGALDEVRALCAHYERLFSRTDPASQLARLNSAGGQPVEVDAELAALISQALRYCEASGGLYDLTMGAVVRLYDFKRQRLPPQRQVAEALGHVDYRGVEVEGRVVRLRDPLAAIDLGGIAKGYIADRIVETLAGRGATSALVNLGGSIAALGAKPDGCAWRLGLRRPLSSFDQPQPESFAVVEVRDRSIATSGIYERSFERQGRLYHHILDPRNGRPAATDLLSASVIAQRALDADGYSTAL
ncbi:MAG: FAD:protein FMN transferase, partial [Bifidobacteriaceae bacterium]|nr:FAD:protein FMN transferase [Bifidobacteriaceae bacterium]